MASKVYGCSLELDHDLIAAKWDGRSSSKDNMSKNWLIIYILMYFEVKITACKIKYNFLRKENIKVFSIFLGFMEKKAKWLS